MALRLYLDDCAYAKKLADLLRAAGHTVEVPAGVGLTGFSDDSHFSFARDYGFILVTKNPPDFHELHRAYPEHPGIIAIHQDNDVSRDMTYEEIVAAIGCLERVFRDAGMSLANDVHDLNQWRGQSGGAPPHPPERPPPVEPPRPEARRKRRPPKGKSGAT